MLGFDNASSRPYGAHATGPVRIDRAVFIVFAVLTAAMVGLLGRVVQLQVAPGAPLRSLMSDRVTVVPEPGRRGDILDRSGRVLAATRFGYRAFVDPVEFAKNTDVDGALVQIAGALGMSVPEVGQRILARIAGNEERVYNAQFYSPRPGSWEDVHGPRLDRFVALGGVLDDATVDAVKRLKVKGLHLETRPVREMTSDNLVAMLVGKVGFEGLGLIAAERLYEDIVKPACGAFKFVRDARGQPLWVEPDGYTPSRQGEDVRLSIDLELQRILTEELERGVQEADAQGGRAVLMDPRTGEILAMVDIMREARGVVDWDWLTPIPKDKRSGPRYRTVPVDSARAIHPALGRNRCVVDIYEPGSTFKVFMWAGVTDLGLVKPTEVIDTENGSWVTPYGRPVTDVSKRPEMSWTEVLVRSSNIGMVKVTSRMSFEQMRQAVLAFGFGEKTGTGFKSESAGAVTSPKAWSKFTQTSVAFGHEISVTPVQMCRAFSAFCRNGDDAGTLPSVDLLAVDAGAPEPFIRRAVSASTAMLVRATLRGVTHKLDEMLKRNHDEEGWRYELFGKSGTPDAALGEAPKGKKRPKGSDGYYRGQYAPTFIAGGPVDEPRLVCVVVIDDPGPEAINKKHHYGAMAAGPVVRRTMERGLSYLGVPASPPPSDDAPVHAE